MLELLEVLDYVKDAVDEIPTEQQQQLLFKDPEFLSALCQVIGSPMFAQLSLQQENVKESVFASIAKFVGERQMEKSLLLQHLIMQMFIKQNMLVDTESTSGIGKTARSLMVRPGFEKKTTTSSQEGTLNTFLSQLQIYVQQIELLIKRILANENKLLSIITALSVQLAPKHPQKQLQIQQQFIKYANHLIHKTQVGALSLSPIKHTIISAFENDTHFIELKQLSQDQRDTFINDFIGLGIKINGQYDELNGNLAKRNNLLTNMSGDQIQQAKDSFRSESGSTLNEILLTQLIPGKNLGEALTIVQNEINVSRGNNNTLTPLSTKPDPFKK